MGKKMAEELIAELRELMPKTDMKSLKRANEIAEWFKNHPEDKEANEVFLEYMNTNGVDDIELGVRNMRKQVIAEQLEGDMKKLLPLAYIAQHYFNKSGGWLSQRLNGTPVRGRVYTLNSEQKDIFNRALQDLGETIGSFRIA